MTSCLVSSAQEMIGITTAKYGGILSAQMNPATLVLSPLYLDVNIVSANLFVENNYLYMPVKKAGLSRFFGKDQPWKNNGPDKSYGDYYTNSLKYGQAQARITGPSMMVAVGKHAFGLSTSVRSVTSVRDMPYTMAKFFYEGLYFPPQYDIRYTHTDKISFASLHWAEAGLSYSFIFNSSGADVWAGGLTVKGLFGLAGAYADMDHIDYMVPDEDTLIIYNTTIDAGISVPVDYDSNDYLQGLKVRGIGAGIDLGFTWERKLRTNAVRRMNRKLCSQPYQPYHFRVGVSLLDLGSILFTENAKNPAVTEEGLIWPGISNLEYTSINDLSDQISLHFYGDPEALVKARRFRMHLPTRLSLQGDYNLKGSGNWYVNAVAMIPVNSSHASAMQPILLALGARYETAHFQLGMTGSVYDNRWFHLGVNGRFRNFFIGTDNLISFLKVKDYTGTSLYAGLRISLHKGNCRYKGSKCPDEF